MQYQFAAAHNINILSPHSSYSCKEALKKGYFAMVKNNTGSFYPLRSLCPAQILRKQTKLQ